MAEVQTLIELVRSAGPVGFAVLLGYAVHKGWLVLGREHDDCVKQRDAYKALLDNHAVKLEARLDRYESQGTGTNVKTTQ